MSEAPPDREAAIYVAASEINSLIVDLEKKANLADSVLESYYRDEIGRSYTPKLLLNEVVCLIGASLTYYKEMLPGILTSKDEIICYKMKQSEVLALSSFVLTVNTIISDINKYNITLEVH